MHLRVDHPRHSASNHPGPYVYFHSHHFDLTQLPAVLAGAAEIAATYPRIDAVICNAGISSFAGIDWPRAIWAVLTNVIETCTQPDWYIGTLGDLAAPQAQRLTDPAKTAADDPGDAALAQSPEPALGRIFCANVFGHYLLAARLAPRMRRAAGPDQSPGRLILVSSIENAAAAYRPDDLQCLTTRAAYSSSKRLTDVLGLSAYLPACAGPARAFLRGAPAAAPAEAGAPPASADEDAEEGLPRIFVCHPGIVDTGIVRLARPLHYAKLAAFYACRLLGSPWHCIDAYKGACAPAWLALAPWATIAAAEREKPSVADTDAGKDENELDVGYDAKARKMSCRGGRGKWGSATDWRGRERVVRTFAEGWGLGGESEEKDELEELGARAWREMETLRREWEERLRVRN